MSLRRVLPSALHVLTPVLIWASLSAWWTLDRIWDAGLPALLAGDPVLIASLRSYFWSGALIAVAWGGWMASLSSRTGWEAFGMRVLGVVLGTATASMVQSSDAGIGGFVWSEWVRSIGIALLLSFCVLEGVRFLQARFSERPVGRSNRG